MTAQTQTSALVVAAPRLPMPTDESDARRWRVLTNAIFPNARSPDSIVLALDYCRARNLDIMKRPVNIVPMWDAKEKKWIETIWPSINETQITAARSHEWAGMESPEWGPDKTQKFTDDKGRTYEVTFPEWCAVTVYRLVGGHARAFTEPVYWLEAVARTADGVPNAMWRKRPRGQLQKVAKAASLRAAFPEEDAGPTGDEMDGQTIYPDAASEAAVAQPRTDLPKIATPASAAPADAPIEHDTGDYEAGEERIDPDTGEVTEVVKAPHKIEGKTWADFMEPMTAALLASRSIAEWDQWIGLNQETLLKLKESKPDLYKIFDKNVGAKHKELTGTGNEVQA